MEEGEDFPVDRPPTSLVSPAPSAKCSCQIVKGEKKRHKDTRDKQQTVFIVEII